MRATRPLQQNLPSTSARRGPCCGTSDSALVFARAARAGRLDRRAGRAGSATVEFAVTLPLYLMLFFGILYFGWGTYVDQEVNFARAYATYRPGGDDRAAISGFVNSRFVGQINHTDRLTVAVTEAENVELLSISDDGQEEYWDGQALDDSHAMNIGPFSNYHHLVDTGDFDPTIAETWMNVAHTRIKYRFDPYFARFVFPEDTGGGGAQLTPGEYMTLNYRGSAPEIGSNEFHASTISADSNNRWTANSYRNEQENNSALPASGDEERLWTHLKVEDMKRLLSLSRDNDGSTMASYYVDDLPPSDTALDDGTGIVMPRRWENDHRPYNWETGVDPGTP